MKQVLTKLGQTKANIDLSGIANARSASFCASCSETQLPQNSRYTEPKSLMPFRQKFFSQYGQDGMLAEIFAASVKVENASSRSAPHLRRTTRTCCSSRAGQACGSMRVSGG